MKREIIIRRGTDLLIIQLSQLITAEEYDRLYERIDAQARHGLVVLDPGMIGNVVRDYHPSNWVKPEVHIPEAKEPIMVVCRNSISKWIIPDAYYDRGRWYELATAGGEEDLGEEGGFRYHVADYRQITDEVIAWQYLPEVPDD